MIQAMEHAATPVAIEAEGLSKQFFPVRSFADLLAARRRQRTTALDDVSMQIRSGELFGILGENGAGKTTLIRILSTTLLPTAGRARILGRDVVREADAVRGLIGVVSGDERSFYWRLTGRQNLEYFAALYHMPRRTIARRIDELLALLDIAGPADRRFDGYSTGMKQRFAIARGMLTDPKVLFLDEPTRALDPIAAGELRQHLAEEIIGRFGFTALLATHTLSEAEAICDRVAIMRGGKLIHVGSVAELRASMGLSPALELLLSDCSAELAGRVSRMVGAENVAVEPDDDRVRLRLNLPAGEGAITEILRAVVDSGSEIFSTTMREPTLDDVYRRAHA
jgi:ABC-2 type transport system ATP-binding protein